MKYPYTIYNLELSIGYSGANQEMELDITEEYDEEDWNAMSDEQKEHILEEATKDFAENYIEYIFYPVYEDD